MTVAPADIARAYFVVSLAPDLIGTAAPQVAAYLLARVNRRTGRLDPGIEGMARALGISRATAMRGLQRICVNPGAAPVSGKQRKPIELFLRRRHRGPGGRNAYQVNWALFRRCADEFEAALRSKRPLPEVALVQHAMSQECDLDGSTDATSITQKKKTQSLNPQLPLIAVIDGGGATSVLRRRVSAKALREFEDLTRRTKPQMVPVSETLKASLERGGR